MITQIKIKRNMRISREAWRHGDKQASAGVKDKDKQMK